MSENNNPQRNIAAGAREGVLAKIRAGEVHMTPRSHFVVRVVLLVVVAGATLVTSVVLMSFMLFSLRVSGQLLLLGFGWQGIQSFLSLFPWPLLLIEAGLLWALERLLRHFRFGYRSPLMYLLLATAATMLLGGYLLNFTPLHRQLLHRAEHQDLPLIGDFYQPIRRPTPDRGIFKGTVVSVSGSTFVIRNDYYGAEGSTTQEVEATPDTDLASFLEPGDKVFVAGMTDGRAIHAYGITKVTDDLEAQ